MARVVILSQRAEKEVEAMSGVGSMIRHLGREEGIKEGIKEGRKEGEFNALYKIIKQGLLTVEQAAKSLGLTKKQLLAGFKQYNLAL